MLVLGAIALVGACATVDESSRQLANTQVCCAKLSELKFYPAPARDERIPFELGPGSPAYQFKTGKSYFFAVALPVEMRPARIKVVTHVTGSAAFEPRRWSQVFCSRVAFLDDSFELIAEEQWAPQYLVPRGWGGGDAGFTSFYDVPDRARYAVIHSNPEYFGLTVVRYTSGGAYVVGGNVVVERGGEPIYHPCGPNADGYIRLLRAGQQ